jgi:hypothetical protein
MFAIRASLCLLLILIYQNPDAIVDAVIHHPPVMIAGDGIGLHPRCAGTFSRVARYVRSQGGQVLEGVAPGVDLASDRLAPLP